MQKRFQNLYFLAVQFAAASPHFPLPHTRFSSCPTFFLSRAARPQATTAEIKKKASVFASPLRCVEGGNYVKFFKLKV